VAAHALYYLSSGFTLSKSCADPPRLQAAFSKRQDGFHTPPLFGLLFPFTSPFCLVPYSHLFHCTRWFAPGSLSAVLFVFGSTLVCCFLTAYCTPPPLSKAAVCGSDGFNLRRGTSSRYLRVSAVDVFAAAGGFRKTRRNGDNGIGIRRAGPRRFGG